MVLPFSFFQTANSPFDPQWTEFFPVHMLIKLCRVCTFFSNPFFPFSWEDFKISCLRKTGISLLVKKLIAWNMWSILFCRWFYPFTYKGSRFAKPMKTTFLASLSLNKKLAWKVLWSSRQKTCIVEAKNIVKSSTIPSIFVFQCKVQNENLKRDKSVQINQNK